ncbi:MAG: sporulation transcription factor Spo0A [Clostridia bacterium]
MSKVRLMLVDDNNEMRRMLSEYFERQEDVAISGMASNGTEALQQIEESLPDVILLDMIMPQMDGFAVLQEIKRRAYSPRPEIIALTALNRDDFIGRAIDMGVRYYMVKPFDFGVVHQRVLEAAGSRVMAPMEVKAAIAAAHPHSMEERIASIFLTVGIPAHIKGYQFLREGVRMVIESPDLINRITKELYPGIARRFNTTSIKVERAIRHAIEVAWNRGRIDVLNQVFGNHVCRLDNKPTNGEFIALVADKLSLERSA